MPSSPNAPAFSPSAHPASPPQLPSPAAPRAAAPDDAARPAVEDLEIPSLVREALIDIITSPSPKVSDLLQRFKGRTTLGATSPLAAPAPASPAAAPSTPAAAPAASPRPFGGPVTPAASGTAAAAAAAAAGSGGSGEAESPRGRVSDLLPQFKAMEARQALLGPGPLGASHGRAAMSASGKGLALRPDAAGDAPPPGGAPPHAAADGGDGSPQNGARRTSSAHSPGEGALPRRPDRAAAARGSEAWCRRSRGGAQARRHLRPHPRPRPCALPRPQAPAPAPARSSSQPPLS